MPTLETFTRQSLAKLAENQRKRELKSHFQEGALHVEAGGRRYLSFASNDYLALSHHPEVVKAGQAALKKYGAGATASRLVVGNHPLYAKLESVLANYKGYGAAMVVGSGYLTSLGVIPALAGKGDLILADKLIHACMVDGAMLSGATFKRFNHNDVSHLEKLLKEYRKSHANCLVLTEHVFSMDGDLAPLAALKKLCKKYDAWLISDDAHGLGIVEGDAKPDVLIGTLSKSLGAYGGYVAAAKPVIDYLQSSARSLIFSTALPPATLASALKALEIIRKDSKRGEKALENARYFTKKMNLPLAESSVVPLIFGTAEKATKAMESLKKAGFWVPAIRPPTVPQGTARLRFSFTAAHEKAHIDGLINALRK